MGSRARTRIAVDAPGLGAPAVTRWQPVWLMLRGWERLRVVGAEKLPTTMPTSPSANREVHIIRP
jgi:hypothetical protein